jgi:hypothetical protein
VSHGTTGQHEKQRVSYAFKGQFQNQGKWVRVLGQSNLKKGTRLFIQLNDKKLSETAVKKDGSFYTDFDRKEINVPGDLTVEMVPMDQNEEIKKVYGPQGEYLTGKFCFNGTEKGVKYTGLKTGMLITKEMVSEQFSKFGSAPFLSLDEIKQIQEELNQKDKNKGGS